MFEELYAPLPNKKAYLDRIGYEKDSVDNAEELNTLVVKNLCTIPFENLSVLGSAAPPSIGIEDLYDKIIAKKRGGYCFELNALFYSLLKAMKVEAYPVLARIPWGKDFFPPYSHRAAIATMEGKQWLCDVGYGGPCPVGILCVDTEEEQPVRNAVFKVLKKGGTATVYRFSEGEFKPMLAIDLTPADPVDFVPINFHIGMNPTSYFRSKTIVSVHTDAGMKCIDGNAFRETENGVVTRNISIANESEEKAILKKEFGIEI